MAHGWLLWYQKNGRSIGKIKPKQEWDEFDNKSNEANVNALYYFFNGVSPHVFRKMVICKYAKEA